MHQETTTVTSDTALAETMTNLMGKFIVAWDGNAFPATIPRRLVTPPLDQDLNRVFVNTLLIISVISLQHVSKTLFQLWSQTSVFCEDNLE